MQQNTVVKQWSQNKMACSYLIFLSLSFMKDYLHNFCSDHLFLFFFFFAYFTTCTYHSTCSKYSGFAARIQCIPECPKKEWEHRSEIPFVCNFLSFMCWLIGFINSLFLTYIMTSWFEVTIFAGCQSQVAKKSSYWAFRFHGSRGTKAAPPLLHWFICQNVYIFQIS